MKTEVKKLKDNNIELNVSVPAEIFKKSIGQAYKDISKKVSIPGFRKGKIPAKVIDSKIGKEAVLEEAIRNNINNYYSDALEKSEIEPIDKPDIEITNVDETEGLFFTAKVQVKPEVMLKEYKSIKLEKPVVKITDADIDKQIDLIREKFASVEPSKGKNADKGDYVLINFDGTINGQPFEGGSAKDYLLEIGSNTLLPDFEKGLEGSRAGEIRDVKVVIPEDYPAKDIAGKTINFRVLIKEVKIKSLPVVDDEFVKVQLGGFENLSELKKEIKDDLINQAESTAENQYRTDIIDLATEKAEVNVPDKMIEDETEQLIDDFEYGLKIRGTDMESYLNMTNQNMDNIKDSFKEEAEKRVRRNLVIEAIAEKEKITPSEIEINAEIKKMYESSKNKSKNKLSFQDFKNDLKKRGLNGYVETSLRYRKTIDFLEKQAESNDIK